jgi:hypothetical protein
VYGVLEGLTIMLLLRRYQHLAIGGPLCIKKEIFPDNMEMSFLLCDLLTFTSCLLNRLLCNVSVVCHGC